MMPPDATPPEAGRDRLLAGEDGLHPDEPAHAPIAVPPPAYHWYHKMSAVVFITFCLEMGLYLLIAPWTDSWDTNYFSGLVPQLRDYWGNLYVRGAVSGLGMVNLYISLVEIFRLRRFSRR